MFKYNTHPQSLSWDFQGPARCSWMPRELWHSSTKAKTHSPCVTIQGPRRLMREYVINIQRLVSFEDY